MKALSKTMAVIACLAFILFGCQPDNVKPVANSQTDTPSLTPDDLDPHPLPDPVCSRFDTIRLATAAADFQVNYCGSFNNVPLACPPNMPDWGFVEVLNGETILLMNFTLAIGWFADLNRSSIGLGSNFQLDQNGIPTSNNDWQSLDIDPVVNKWQLVYQLEDLPSPCFSVALQLEVVKLNFFSGIDAGSATNLWGYNEEWQDPNNPAMNSSTAFLTPWCPMLCGPDPADCTRDFLTYTQCQYGICGNEGPAATYLTNNFTSAFPLGLTLGCANGYVATFSDASAIEAFLPTQGGQDVLTQNLTDPTGRVAGNSTFNFCGDYSAAAACGAIDFNSDTEVGLPGNPMPAGTYVTNQFYDDFGLTISGNSNNSNRSGDVIIFNSSAPTGGDWDLGTPNSAFGGPGQGSGGTNPNGLNNIAEGNLIILAENTNDNNSDGLVDNPDDDASGGTITFDFENPMTLKDITLVDLDDNANNFFKIYFADNRPPLVISCPQLGNNSRKVVPLTEADLTDADNVVRMEVTFAGSGAISGMSFCRENIYATSNCVSNSGTAMRSTLAGRLVAAMLNVRFDDYDPNFGGANYPLSYMEVRTGPFAGKTVMEVLVEANSFIGGCPSTYTASQFKTALNRINSAFLGGVRSGNYLVCPAI